MTDVVVPNVGESISSGILASWLKQEGELVQEGDNLFELETDKATLEIPAPTSGLLHIQVDLGTEVPIGSVVAGIDENASAEAQPASAGAQPAPSPAKEEPPVSPASNRPPTEKPAAPPDTAPKENQNRAQNKPPEARAQRTLEDLSPAVRRLVEELALDPADIPAADSSGRLSKEDIQNYVKSRNGSAGKAPISPTALKKSPPLQGNLQPERQERVAMTNLRKRIGERLVESKQTSAHLTTFNEVDMKAVMDIRKLYKERFEQKHGVRLGFMSFFLKAAAKALQQFPEVNAFVDGTDIIYNHFYDISVAISSDRGLITPVLRNVDQKSFADIELGILDFSKRAQKKKIMPDELMGGTFTISNGGVFGSMLSTPIPNPPQTAILGIHSIQEKPVVRNAEIVIRPMMYLALTYDHRILDGREAIGFLRTIKEGIEDPNGLLLDV